MPAGSTGAANYDSGDFGTSPFFGQLSGKTRPASTYVPVVPRAKHNGAARIYCAIEAAVVVLATSIMTVVGVAIPRKNDTLPFKKETGCG